MAGIEGSGPIRLGSNSAQVPILLAKTKAPAFDKPQQEAGKNLPPGTTASPQTAAVPASTAASQNMQLQVRSLSHFTTFPVLSSKQNIA